MVALLIEPWFNLRMLKSKAIQMLGGSTSAAAAGLGVSYQAIDKWPDVLPERIAKRVLGAVALQRYPELAAEAASVSEPGEISEAKAVA